MWTRGSGSSREGAYETYEGMHWVCFHYEYEHGDLDVDSACRDPGCTSRMVDPDPPPHWLTERSAN